jgi:hypothetical protein
VTVIAEFGTVRLSRSVRLKASVNVGRHRRSLESISREAVVACVPVLTFNRTKHFSRYVRVTAPAVS